MTVPPEVRAVARRLHSLRGEAVFVGGMIRDLLVTDPASIGSRPTKDVDLILDVRSWPAYLELGATLRSNGFRECVDEGAPICRWVVDGILADIMPIDPAILGFTNVWYAEAFLYSTTLSDPDGPVRVLDAPRFCATKLEAFAGRGNRDYYHHDIEDVVAVIDGRPSFIQELRAGPEDLREFLSATVGQLLGTPAFIEALPGHLRPDEASQARVPMILSALEEIARETPSKGRENLRAGARSRSPARTAPGDGHVLAHTFEISSELRTATYDQQAKELTIEFRDGRADSFSEVPSSVYAGLTQAYSAGRYFHYWIRSRYRTDR